jgi:hypothetical protein
MLMVKTRKDLCAQALYATVKGCFTKKFSQRPHAKAKAKIQTGISIVDCLMSGVALFALKFPSLLQYDIKRRHPRIANNLKTLFGVRQAPCDTYMRERLDVIDPRLLRNAFKAIFADAQRGKVLEPYRYLDGKYLLSVDGTGHFSSGSIHCENCCVKETRGGQTSYYHQMLAAVIVHPDQRQVIPLVPEPILKKHGATKNDCERNAAKRLLEDVRLEHPHLDLIVVEDSLASNGPHIQELQRHKMSYILGVKPGDHAFLFDWVRHSDKQAYEEVDKEGTRHQYSFVNGVPLNDTHFDLKVNFLEYWETDKKGNKQHFTWVTNIAIKKSNVSAIMKGGRARWRIENNTFNTLKNQGYNFEHNFGHGYQNLCTVLGLLMMLAFLIDQVQELTCQVFKKARKLTGSYSSLWENIRGLFIYFDLESWNDLMARLIEANTPNTS